MPFKIGDKIRILRNIGGHNYRIGEVYTISNINGNNINAFDPRTMYYGNNLTENEIELFLDKIRMTDLVQQEKDIEDDIARQKFIYSTLEKDNKDIVTEKDVLAEYLLYLVQNNKKEMLVKVLNEFNNKVDFQSINVR